jgi:hypothetical protein
MPNDIEDRTARYRNELAQCDRDDRSAENAEMCAPALGELHLLFRMTCDRKE